MLSVMENLGTTIAVWAPNKGKGFSRKRNQRI